MTTMNSTLPVQLVPAAGTPRGPMKGRLASIDHDGTLGVQLPDGSCISCDWLDTGFVAPRLALGDLLLVWPPAGDGRGVVIGRIAPYRQGGQVADLAIEASQSLTIRCGDSSIDLRADGKVMIRGDDVLVRAKGTSRIRAGTVSIN